MTADIRSVSVADVPPITNKHFLEALASIRPSVSEKDLHNLMAWNEEFGTYKRMEQGGGGGPGSGEPLGRVSTQ